MTFNVDSSGLGALRAALQTFGRQVKQEVAFEGVAAMALVVYKEARLNASVHKKSGRLYSAIYRVYSPELSSSDVKTYRVSWNRRKAPHGHLQEFGTANAPAHPFLRPAMSVVPAALEAGRVRMRIKIAELDGKA